MHFSTFVLAAAAVPAAVRGLTLFSNFDCGGVNTTSTVVGCVGACQSFEGFHSFQNNEVVIPQYVQTYENDVCANPVGQAPVNFTAAPRACVAAITGRSIGSYKCSTTPF